MVRSDAYSTVRVVGGFVPDGSLSRLAAGQDYRGLEPNPVGQGPGQTIRSAANREWPRLVDAWRRFEERLEVDPERSGTAGSTRDRWLRYLLQALGYGYQVPRAPAEGLPTGDGDRAPISHVWNGLPIHLVGAGTALDRAPGRGKGARRRAPFSLVQDFLNRSDQHLWGLVSNGRHLMLVRDSASLARQSYLWFDLERMFGDEVFTDFVVLFATCHASGFVPRNEGEPPRTCWIERWREAAIGTG